MTTPSPRPPTWPRRAIAITAVVALIALLTGCSTRPPQEERIAGAIEALDTVTLFAVDAAARVPELYPDLGLDYGENGPDLIVWRSCTDEPSDEDGPEAAYWLNGVTYTVDPRRATDRLIEPLAQTYVDDGWTLYMDEIDTNLPHVWLSKGGYRMKIGGLTQEHLDQHPQADGRLAVHFYSPCVLTPDVLTGWDPAHPHDFDLARTDE